MLCYDWLSKRGSLFRSLTGLEVSEFDSFYTKAAAEYANAEVKRLFREDRARTVGAGHPFKLPLKERLLMFLMYYRLYITSSLLGVLFDLDQSNVLKDIRKLEPFVKEILPLPKKLHERVKQLQTLEEIEAMFPELKAFTDATEQSIPRPKSKRKRRTHYSSKTRRHTLKTQLTVNINGLIIHKTRHARGRTHDYKLFKHCHPHLPDNVQLGLDLGYLGVKLDFPGMNCVLPFKKRNPGRGKRGVKAQELSIEKKSVNTVLGKERVISEHTNARLKKFMIWGGNFRNRLKHYDIMTDIVCGLLNLRTLGASAT
jgi:hypothetical protein